MNATAASPASLIVMQARLGLEAWYGGRLIGTALRSRGEQGWVGWLIECGEHREVAPTVMAAASALRTAALNEVLAAQMLEQPQTSVAPEGADRMVP